MNASEILELVRAGYTRAEIDAMNADPEPAHDEPNPEPAHDEHDPDPEHDEHDPDPEHDPVPAWAQTLNKTLDDLRKTIQASNIRGDDMGDEIDAIDAAELAAVKYLTGKEPESAKSKGGAKRK